MEFKTFFTAAAMAIGLSSAPSFAATLNVDGSGQLTGASGVNVGGTLYDVTFVDGTCTALFDGCDDVSDFTFTTRSDALAASQALLDFVFIGDFDSVPNATFGVAVPLGAAWTPYGFDSSMFTFAYAINSASTDSFGSGQNDVDFNTGSSDQDVFADWTVATVPIPAGGMLLLSALGGIAALRRRLKSTV